MAKVEQVLPIQQQVQLEGLYLEQKLRELSSKIGRSIVLTDFLADKNGVVAKADKNGHFQVPADLKNSSDWELFQELLAQADVTISSGSYFKRLETSQDILYQFEPGNAFEKLGQWRLGASYKKRSPDVAIVTRHLDFELPKRLLQSDRRIIIFTTDLMADTDKARGLKDAGSVIIGCGKAGVAGDRMISSLATDMGYRVIMMVSGPHVLDILLKARSLDLLYVTEAQVAIPFDSPGEVQTLLSGGRKLNELKEFQLAHQFNQENVVTEKGSVISQSFLKYERQDLPMK